MIDLESAITSVTVFTDRALVKRQAEVQLEKGEHLLVFNNLPSAIERKSIQVNGKGRAIILDVSVKEVSYLETPEGEVLELQRKKQLLNDQLEELEDTLEEAGKENALLERITTKLTAENKKEAESTVDLLAPEKWEPFIQFYRNKQGTYNTENRTIEKEKTRIGNEISHINSAIDQLDEGQYETGYRAEVKLEATAEENEVSLELQYIVEGPSWTPSYDLRLDSEKKTVKLTYKANVAQNTTEDWSEVNLELSTAQPQVNNQQKVLRPVYLDLQSALNSFEEASESKIDEVSEIFASSAPEPLAKKEMAKPRKKAMRRKPARVEHNRTSVQFVIPGEYTIPKDNQPHEVTIAIEELEAELYYSTIPKLEEVAYLKAEITNKTDYPFLAGIANVFMDNAFVTNEYLSQIMPLETIHLAMGTDRSLKVEYKFINKFSKNEGFVSKKSKIYFQYEISVTNNKATTESIVIQDHLPISSHQNIKVELVEPSLKEAKHGLVKKEHELLEWTAELKAQETVCIPFQYSIEYPSNDEFVYS